MELRLVDTRVHRRRRHTLAGVALAALVVGVAVGAGAGEDSGSESAEVATPAASRDAGAATPDPLAAAGANRADGSASPAGGDTGPTAAAAKLSLKRQVGQLVVLRYAGTRPPAYVKRALEEGRASGAILFRDNVETRRGLRATTRRLRGAARAGGRATPLICVDQEGGEIRIVPWAGPQRSAEAQAAEERVGKATRAAARTLRSDGITVSLAPVADLPTVDGSAIGTRAFGREPRVVRSAVAAAVDGWQAGRIAPTLKHFPGIGGTRTNTDHDSSTITRSREALETVDLPPFAAGIRAGAPLVMLGHARYPAIDARNIASQSRAVLRLLRRKLGFKGVTMTDSLEAAAVRALPGGTGRAAIRSVAAGVDIMLTTGQGSYLRVYRALLRRARADEAFRARVAEAADRILKLRRDVLARR